MRSGVDNSRRRPLLDAFGFFTSGPASGRSRILKEVILIRTASLGIELSLHLDCNIEEIDRSINYRGHVTRHAEKGLGVDLRLGGTNPELGNNEEIRNDIDDEAC
jgi:hypothetical protein